jgi:hypothetical protein
MKNVDYSDHTFVNVCTPRGDFSGYILFTDVEDVNTKLFSWYEGTSHMYLKNGNDRSSSFSGLADRIEKYVEKYS